MYNDLNSHYMRNLICILCLMCGLIVPINISAQNYIEYLHNAQKQFSAGEYVNAKKSLTVYHEMIGYTKETGFASKIDLCIEYLHKAEEEKNKQFYSSAIEYYKLVMGINPHDPKVSREIALLQNLISQKDESNAGSSSSKEPATTYKIGDKLPNGYIVCFLDNSGEHGWVMTSDNLMGLRKDRKDWRVPSKEEMQEIYKNRYKLGLNGRYWTSTRSRKVGNWVFYYTLDFGTGEIKSTDGYKSFPYIYIQNF